MSTMSATSPFRHARPPLHENTGSTARDYLMLERNLLTHLKLALLLSIVASSVLLKAKIVPSGGDGSQEGGRRSGWLALASFEFVAALFTIGAAVWQYFDASEDMRRARPFMESSRYNRAYSFFPQVLTGVQRVHTAIMTGVVAVIFTTCIVYLAVDI